MNKTLDIFLTFLKIGVITFGGGYAMISLVDEEIVAKKKWLDEEEFTSICGIAESTPGPISINLATYIGYKQNKLLGSILATLGVVLPSLLIIFGISLIFNQFLANEYVAKAFIGIKCAVSYLIIKAGLNMFMKSDKRIIDFEPCPFRSVPLRCYGGIWFYPF